MAMQEKDLLKKCSSVLPENHKIHSGGDYFQAGCGICGKSRDEVRKLQVKKWQHAIENWNPLAYT